MKSRAMRERRSRTGLRLARTPLLGVAVAGLFALTALAPATAFGASFEPGDEADSESEVFEGEFTGPLTPSSEPGEEIESPSPSANRDAVCLFTQRVDYVHFSSSPGARAVQSHGNWDNETCNYSLADVTTQIDRRNFLGLYQAVGTPGTERMPPNPRGLTSGGVGRVTARYECNGSTTDSFRSWTSVDIVGYADTPNSKLSPPTDKACG